MHLSFDSEGPSDLKADGGNELLIVLRVNNTLSE